MPIASQQKLIHAHFFFIDIVESADPTLAAASQIKKIKFLNDAIARSRAYQQALKKDRIVLPTGDGMVIAFLRDSHLPLELAIELHQKIWKYNIGKLAADSVGVRIGIHKGSCFVLKDLNGNDNIWGPGIILARRIMDFGEDGHILLSSSVASDMIQTSERYRSCLRKVGPGDFKHSIRMNIYSAYSNIHPKFGNSAPPKRIQRPNPLFTYPYIEVKISILNVKKMLVHYKRLYEIENDSSAEVSIVSHQIATDLEKSFDDLHIRVYDEDGKDLSITNIAIDKPHQKEFDTAFHRPIKPGHSQRYYVEYDLEEPDRYFENRFFTDCGKFIVEIEYPEASSIRPVAYEIEGDTEKRVKHPNQPKVVEQAAKRITVHWEIEEGMTGQAFRFEW